MSQGRARKAAAIPYLALMIGMIASTMVSGATASQLHPRARTAASTAADHARMATLVAFTARSLTTASPRPFGASIVHTQTGEPLIYALNSVRLRCDPSAHAEVHAIRLGTRKLKTISLAGYTLYTTCEPCPMCMGSILWAGVDRVVYGATIADANVHCNQIRIPAREVAMRSDMRCGVEGPILRDECYALFTHPNMKREFKSWSTRKRRNTTSS